MAIEWIDVIDSAVKIGLGAIISGCTGYTIAKMNNNKEFKKNLGNKKIEIIEDICVQSEEYFYFFTSLHNKVWGISKLTKNDLVVLSEKQINYIKDRQEDIVDILKKRNQALGKIKLLGINSAVEEIIKFNDYFSNYRDLLAKNRDRFSASEMDHIYCNARECKDKFYEHINTYFSSIYK